MKDDRRSQASIIHGGCKEAGTMSILARCTAPSNSGFIYSPLSFNLTFPFSFHLFSFASPPAKKRQKETYLRVIEYVICHTSATIKALLVQSWSQIPSMNSDTTRPKACSLVANPQHVHSPRSCFIQGRTARRHQIPPRRSATHQLPEAGCPQAGIPQCNRLPMAL